MTTEQYDTLTRPYLERIAEQRQIRNWRENTYFLLSALLLCIFVAAFSLTLAFMLNH